MDKVRNRSFFVLHTKKKKDIKNEKKLAEAN